MPAETSPLFQEGRIGKLLLPNRFVRSATFEAMAEEDGSATPRIARFYRKLAAGGVGLAITGHMYVQFEGRGHPLQIGIHDDAMLPGLSLLASTVHEAGGRIFFQLSHAGRQTTSRYTGVKPAGPSAMGKDPVYFERCRAMTEEEIQETISAFGQAARRAAQAGADGIQLLAAHGYLLSEFLSPFFNRRKDRWGGNAENRFRLLQEVVLEVKRNVPADYPVCVKLNGNDHTIGRGVSPRLAATYAAWLSALGVDAVEVSAGSIVYSFAGTIRGTIPAGELVRTLPFLIRAPAWLVLKAMQRIWPYSEGYNMSATREIRAAAPELTLIAVGGFNELSAMEEALAGGTADFIALGRPLVENPRLVNEFKEGRRRATDCIHCNRCFAALAYNRPLSCYVKGIPGVSKKKTRSAATA